MLLGLQRWRQRSRRPSRASVYIHALIRTGVSTVFNADSLAYTDSETHQGWDHGVFVPLISINPSADIPVVQVSVLTSEDPYQHVLMGRALGALRSSNIAIIGSGSPSFHNSPLIFSGFTSKSDFKKRYARWNQKLDDIIKESSRKLRTEQILKWRDLPNAYEMHPRHGAEHFLPLIVCVGAAGDGECSSHPVEFLGMGTTTYYWD